MFLVLRILDTLPNARKRIFFVFCFHYQHAWQLLEEIAFFHSNTITTLIRRLYLTNAQHLTYMSLGVLQVSQVLRYQFSCIGVTRFHLYNFNGKYCKLLCSICQELSDDNETILEWGRCLPECPAEEVRPVCQMLPEFPALGDGVDRSVNYTTNIEGWTMRTKHITHGVRISNL